MHKYMKLAGRFVKVQHFLCHQSPDFSDILHLAHGCQGYQGALWSSICQTFNQAALVHCPLALALDLNSGYHFFSFI